MDPRTLLFRDNLFTHVYCDRLTGWDGEDIQRVLTEIYRTLQPSGHAFFSIVGNFDWMPALWEALNCIRPDDRHRPLRMSDDELLTNLIDALITAGFAIEEMQAYKNTFVFEMDPQTIYRWATIQYWPETRQIVNLSEFYFRNAFMALLTDAQRYGSQMTAVPVFNVVVRKSAGPAMRGARTLR